MLVDKVTYLDGMAAIAAPKAMKGGGAFTIGYTSVGPKNYTADWRDHLFVYEYGHYIQSQRIGAMYLPIIGVTSIISASKKDGKHLSRGFEPSASELGAKHFDKHYGRGANGYVEGSDLYFDIDSFRNGNKSPYTNPRTGEVNKKAYLKKDDSDNSYSPMSNIYIF